MKSSSRRMSFLAPILGFGAIAGAQVDNVVVVVSAANTVGGVASSAPIGAFGYAPANGATPERFYAVGFNATGQDIRQIDGVAGGTPSFTRLVTNSPYLKFTKDGDLTRGGGTPTPGSLLINRVATATIPAYGAAFIADGASQVSTGGTQNPELSRKIYRYNLALDTNADAREEMTSLVTLKQMQDAIGSTTSSSNTGRQVALSSDANTVYFVDTSTAYGGLWSVPSAGGVVQRIVADANLGAEPAVLSVGGADRIYFNGTTTTINAGGIDYYDTSDNARKIAVTNVALAAFLESNTTDINISSMTADADGNLYFNNTDSSPERRGIYRLDVQGRLIKVVSQAERVAVVNPTGTLNSNTLRMQPRATTFTGAAGAFDVTQILYTESSPINAVGGAYVFKPGDFDRDNAVTQAELSAFGAKLTPLATVSLIPIADSRYDLNGNNLINQRDVKVLQSFLGFPDGDTNFDFAVNFDDLLVLAQNYEAGTGKTWITGDFEGDDIVDFDDLLTLAQNYQAGPGLSLAGLVDASFASDWALARSLVPEPSMIALTAGPAILALRRRRSAV